MAKDLQGFFGFQSKGTIIDNFMWDSKFDAYLRRQKTLEGYSLSAYMNVTISSLICVCSVGSEGSPLS